jgi:hypothetical protein
MKMDLRDTFAAAVLAGMQPAATLQERQGLAKLAYAMADAMVEARGVGQETGLEDVKERLHTALRNLSDVADGLTGNGPNATKIREAMTELRLSVITLRKMLNSGDVGNGEGKSTLPQD